MQDRVNNDVRSLLALVPAACPQVQPNSISEQCGLKGGDAILSINGVNTDHLTHEQAKQEIVRAGCELDFLVQRWVYTPSLAFLHLPPNSARIGYATEGALFISAQLSTVAVSALRNVWVLIRLWNCVRVEVAVLGCPS